MTRYIIRAALHEEANEGWIWQARLPSRTVVIVTRKVNGKRYSVYCQVRKIDKNFVDRYNQTTEEKNRLVKGGKNYRRDIKLDKACETIVIGDWYRCALGGFGTTDEDDETGRRELDDPKPYDRWYNHWWGSLRAAAHHPDIIVRLGTRLGVIGAWLGLVGVVAPLLQMVISCRWVSFTVTAAILIVFALLGTWACRPPTFETRTRNCE